MPSTNAKKALIILAKGAEEMETVIPADVLRRAGIKVTIAGLDGKAPVLCSRGVKIVPDTSLEEARNNEYDIIILPGGSEGAERLARSEEVKKLLFKQDKENKLIGAICAAPIALNSADVIHERSFTCHPAVRDDLQGAGGWVSKKVVKDGNLITSQGPGTAFSFALNIVEALLGKEMAEKVADPMLIKEW